MNLNKVNRNKILYILELSNKDQLIAFSVCLTGNDKMCD